MLDENSHVKISLSASNIWQMIALLITCMGAVIYSAIWADDHVIAAINQVKENQATIQRTIDANHELGVRKREELEASITKLHVDTEFEIQELRQTVYDFIYYGQKDYDPAHPLPHKLLPNGVIGTRPAPQQHQERYTPE